MVSSECKRQEPAEHGSRQTLTCALKKDCRICTVQEKKKKKKRERFVNNPLFFALCLSLFPFFPLFSPPLSFSPFLLSSPATLLLLLLLLPLKKGLYFLFFESVEREKIKNSQKKPGKSHKKKVDYLTSNSFPPISNCAVYLSLCVWKNFFVRRLFFIPRDRITSPRPSPLITSRSR